MAEPLTLALVGSMILTEGIKFLYAQAGDALKRWRERKDKQAQGSAGPPTTPVPIASAPPADVFQGHLAPLVLDFGKLEPLAESMREIRGSLADYADGVERVDSENDALLERVDTMRRQLEAVFGQRISFNGEQRPPAGSPVVVGAAEVTILAGEAAGVIARNIRGGTVRGRGTADKVESTGRLYGVKVEGDVEGV
jgi:hypothetical protein